MCVCYECRTPRKRYKRWATFSSFRVWLLVEFIEEKKRHGNLSVLFFFVFVPTNTKFVYVPTLCRNGIYVYGSFQYSPFDIFYFSFFVCFPSLSLPLFISLPLSLVYAFLSVALLASEKHELCSLKSLKMHSLNMDRTEEEKKHSPTKKKK